MAEAFVGLGANLGDRVGQLRRGVRALHEQGARLRELSRFSRTAPVGGPPQPDYVNAVARIEWSASPHALLRLCQEVERRMGRVRTVVDGPRTCDLDLLWFAGWPCASVELTLPHPRMHERRFVLEPLAQLAPRLHVHGRYVTEHLASLD